MQFTHSQKAALAIWYFGLTNKFQPGMLNLPAFFPPVVLMEKEVAASRELVSSAYKLGLPLPYVFKLYN